MVVIYIVSETKNGVDNELTVGLFRLLVLIQNTMSGKLIKISTVGGDASKVHSLRSRFYHDGLNTKSFTWELVLDRKDILKGCKKVFDITQYQDYIQVRVKEEDIWGVPVTVPSLGRKNCDHT